MRAVRLLDGAAALRQPVVHVEELRGAGLPGHHRDRLRRLPVDGRPDVTGVSVTGAQIVSEVKKFLGDPYIYGAAGPTTFDCSGLVQYALTKLGVKAVPRTSEAQYGWAQKISASQLQPGDLVFSQWPGDNASPGHVAIYAGGGQIIEAPAPGMSVHQIPLDASYKSHVIGYGRAPGLPAASGASSGGGGGLLGLVLPQQVLDVFSGAEQLAQSAMWIINPENWARIMAGAFGFFLAAFGVGFLIAAAALWPRPSRSRRCTRSPAAPA